MAVGTALVVQIGDAGMAAGADVPDDIGAWSPALVAEGFAIALKAFAAFQADEMGPVRPGKQLLETEGLRIRQPAILGKDMRSEKRVANPRLPLSHMSRFRWNRPF